MTQEPEVEFKKRVGKQPLTIYLRAFLYRLSGLGANCDIVERDDGWIEFQSDICVFCAEPNDAIQATGRGGVEHPEMKVAIAIFCVKCGTTCFGASAPPDFMMDKPS